MVFRNRLRIEAALLPGLSGRRLASSFISKEFMERWEEISLDGGLREICSADCGVDDSLSVVDGRRSSELGSRKIPFGACVLSRSSALMKLIATKSSFEFGSPVKGLVVFVAKLSRHNSPRSVFMALETSWMTGIGLATPGSIACLLNVGTATFVWSR